MKFNNALSPVYNRGQPPIEFLIEMVNWAKAASDDIFVVNPLVDIYSKVRSELGPFLSLNHRRAVMLEVMRVLAGFESSWNWKEGVDTSRLGSDTPENSEAGAWQLSYDARFLCAPLRTLLISKGISSGVKFQQTTKFNHLFAMECVAWLMRYNTKHNGPLYKGSEREIIRSSLRGEQHSIYPWLNRRAVEEFEISLIAS